MKFDQLFHCDGLMGDYPTALTVGELQHNTLQVGFAPSALPHATSIIPQS